jgi:hypothetical protein
MTMVARGNAARPAKRSLAAGVIAAAARVYPHAAGVCPTGRGVNRRGCGISPHAGGVIRAACGISPGGCGISPHAGGHEARHAEVHHQQRAPSSPSSHLCYPLLTRLGQAVLVACLTTPAHAVSSQHWCSAYCGITVTKLSLRQSYELADGLYFKDRSRRFQPSMQAPARRS